MSVRSLFGIALLATSLALSASAATYTVSESGTFGSTTAASAYSTPSGTFAYSFNLSSTPAVSNVSIGNQFTPMISNFSYTLNGVTTAPSVDSATFYNSSNLGLLDVCFSATCPVGSYFVIEGLQAYSGSESAPTILLGSYTPTFASFNSTNLASESNVNITAVATTPEPSSLLLLGTGVLGVAGVVKKRFA